MLDQETKRKIDNARDILVGKVPDPKSQVEQITIALIYKFMDDMDKESVALGGKAAFFKGEYEKYTWSRIFDPKLSGFDLITLYSEAITTMNHNENIPQLFRDIFKNAFLPYRDPETLKSFLKEINEFKYDHSEKLGDAFEYLLSVLGSQGDAGQFRTPRHIIDFIVSVVDPQKNESILDPACGTAGFLISSFKHILSQNTKERKGDCLTIDESKRLMNNLVGYDISPDMVRLSLVNMYLHGFSTPKIHEYDTLTSDEKWNETYDVILANPPFMTPKGGIRPHKRFSVQANRSEVLFVDYIMEHISTNGRGGVIVPEGIIFQSANAYKALRKLLVDTHLFAVVSLPSGVFQPYAGVKTSILLMDRTLAKRAQHILFVKIDSDGFDLGAQRRPNGKSELPMALSALLKFRKSLHEGKECEFSEEESKLAHRVFKTKISESGDYNLSGDRYKDIPLKTNKDWRMVELGDYVEILDNQRRPITKSDRKSGTFPYYGATGILDYIEDYIFDERLVLVGEDGAKWSTGEKTAFIVEGKYWVNNHAHVLRPIKNKLIDTYLVEILNAMDLNRYITGVTVPKLNQEKLRSIKIPLPPLSVQQEIVAEIEGCQKIIDGARQVVENYKPKIKVDDGWEVVELGEVCEKILSGGTPSTEIVEYWNGDIPWITSADIVGMNEVKPRRYITNKAIENSATNLIPKNNIIVVTRVGLGKLLLNNFDLCISQDSQGLIIDKSKVHPEYLLYFLYEEVLRFKDTSRGSTIQGVTKSQLSEIKIFLPPLPIQKEIVARIEEEQKLVDANKKLIELFEGKIKEKIAEVWG